MAEVFKMPVKNELGYSHAMCSRCDCESFHVRTGEECEEEVFESIICKNCGNEIYVNLKPVWGPTCKS